LVDEGGELNSVLAEIFLDDLSRLKRCLRCGGATGLGRDRSRRPSVGGRGGGSRNAGGDITPAETEARRLMFIEKLDSLSAALQFREAPPLDLSQGCAEPQALRGYAVLPGLVHRDLSVPEALLRFQFRERIGRQ
jgi:hypothetical protein